MLGGWLGTIWVLVCKPVSVRLMITKSHFENARGMIAVAAAASLGKIVPKNVPNGNRTQICMRK
jgi:hypothetical protein